MRFQFKPTRQQLKTVYLLSKKMVLTGFLKIICVQIQLPISFGSALNSNFKPLIHI